MQGHGVVHDLCTLLAERQTGVLEVRAKSTTCLFYLKDGTPVFVEEGSAVSLGERLIARGLLTRDQHLETLRQATDFAESEQMLYARTAIELGFLVQADAEETLRMQLQNRLRWTCQHDDSARTFDASPDAVAAVQHFPTDPRPVLMEGIRRYYDDRRILPLLAPHFGTIATLRATPSTIGQSLKLTGAELQIVGRVDGRTPLGSVLDGAGAASATETARTLVALVLMNLLTDEAAEVPATPTGGGPMHGTTPGPRAAPKAPRPSVAAAERPAPSPKPVRTTAARHPPAAQSPPTIAQPRVAPKSPSLIPPAKVPQAPLKLLRRSQIARKRLLIAEQFVRTGLRALEDGAWQNAAAAFKKALSTDDSKSRQWRLYCAWAEYRAGIRSLDDLKGAMAQVLANDREDAFAAYVRGHIYLLDNDEKRALRAFEGAVEGGVPVRDAERQARLLRSRHSKKKKKKKHR